MRLKHLLLTLMAAAAAVATAPLQAQPVVLVGITNSIWSYSIDGSDQYAAGFQSASFDDAAWLTSRGIFGNDAGYPYPYQVTVNGTSGGGPLTAYYRTRFTWNQSINGVVLTMTNYIDDGIIIFLNGVEIGRYNMNADNPPTAGTTAVAANPAGEGVPLVYQFNMDNLSNGVANPLIQGQNVLAVSVHQNGTGSSDHVFGLSVYGSQAVAPCQVTDIGGNRTITACRSTTFTAVIPANCGIPSPTYQWYRNVSGTDELITGATGSSYTLTNAAPSDAGQYFVRLTNPSGSVDSVRASLTVNADTAPPAITQVLAFSTDPTAFLVTFDEPVDDSNGGVSSTFNWAIYPSNSDPSQSLTVNSATLTNGNQVILVTQEPRTSGVNYRLQVGVDATPILDLCAGNALVTATASVYSEVRILHHTDLRNWRYNQSGADQGTAWKEVAFDDSSWAVGPQGFGNETSANFPDAPESQRTPLSAPSASVITVYFRTTFTVPAGAQNVTFYADVDDGAAVYVNGTHIGRVNIAPNLPLAYNTLTPNVYDPDASLYGPPGGLTIPTNILNFSGNNVLAIEVHQNSATSSDVLMIAQITAAVPEIVVVAPTIVQDPVSTTATIGHRFSLSVLATGTEPTYSWSKDGVPLGVTTPTYTVIADANSGGTYRVDVSNSAGSDFATATVTVRPVIASYGQTWRYSQESQDASLTGGGTPWYATGFDDSGWASGPGPFGLETAQGTFPAPIATTFPAVTTTAYFRTTVNVPSIPAGQTLVLCHLVDDGAAVYVDGSLAFLYNFTNNPPNPILFGDLAPGTPPGGDANLVCTPVTLTPGTHTIAVEVHQNSATSSDVVFGAELRTVTKPGPLTITKPTENSIKVDWTADPLWNLVQGPSITGPFTPVAGNPVGTYSTTVPTTATNMFYLLRFNGN